MQIFPLVCLVAVCVVLWKSLSLFVRGKSFRIRWEMRESRFSTELFYTLIVIYCLVIIGFGLIYFILSFQGVILVEGGELRDVSVLGSIIHSMYFSGATLLTIGYGDITPVGIGRLFAVMQALIGYILPTAFVMRLVQIRGRGRDG
ncbi:potassium channel family protein [Lentibacillus sediminis]|uniref:potassium channel family protein n=1 Tax=Lentibacillus sediminis TaxID=1940529 RepID=UPI000C1C66B5|nr:potassium channel family protein [Lentibacillus sediminis]